MRNVVASGTVAGRFPGRNAPAFGPATGLPDDGAVGQKQAEVWGKEQQLEEMGSFVFNHAKEFDRVSPGVGEHRGRCAVGEVEARGCSLLVANAEQGEGDPPGLKPFVGRGLMSEVVAERSFQ